MNKLVSGAIVIAVLAAGYTGAAYWSGTQAERWYQDALAEGSKNPNVKLTTVRYERGLFASHSVTRVQLVLPDSGELKEADPSFSIRQDIYHGPLPLAGWGVPNIPMNWGGAVIRATLDPESSTWTRELSKQYGGQEPLVAISQVGFDGASDTQVLMPPLTVSNVGDLQNLKFSGLQGQFQVAPKATAVRGKMVVASLEMDGKSATDGNTQIKLSNLTLDLNQRKGAFDLMFGESSFKIGEVRVQEQAAAAPFVATNLTMTGIGAINPQDPKQVSGEAVMKADQITVNGRSGSGSLRMALRNLDGATVAKLQQWQQKLPGALENPQALDELLNLVKALLQGKPEYLLETQAKLAEGEWQGKLVLNFQDFDVMSAMQNPMGFLAALEKGLADMTVSKALLETELKKIGEDQALQQLQGMTAAGFIRLVGDQYQSAVRFENGKLSVNGQDIPLPSATAASPGEDASTLEIPLEPDGEVPAPAPAAPAQK